MVRQLARMQAINTTKGSRYSSSATTGAGPSSTDGSEIPTARATKVDGSEEAGPVEAGIESRCDVAGAADVVEEAEVLPRRREARLALHEGRHTVEADHERDELSDEERRVRPVQGERQDVAEREQGNAEERGERKDRHQPVAVDRLEVHGPQRHEEQCEPADGEEAQRRDRPPQHGVAHSRGPGREPPGAWPMAQDADEPRRDDGSRDRLADEHGPPGAGDAERHGQRHREADDHDAPQPLDEGQLPGPALRAECARSRARPVRAAAPTQQGAEAAGRRIGRSSPRRSRARGGPARPPR